MDCERRCEVAVRLAVEGYAASNCIQVAFGRDGDGNGILDYDEDETVYGWWAGRYFAESCPDRLRVYEAASDGAHCDFTVSLRLRKGEGLRKFAAVDAAGAALGIAGMGNYMGAGIQSVVSGYLIRRAEDGTATLVGHTFENGWTLDYLAVFWIGMAALSVVCVLAAGKGRKAG